MARRIKFAEVFFELNEKKKKRERERERNRINNILLRL